jgi:small GTP-binding protein
MNKKKILFLGLDNAGKTAFINALDKEYDNIQNLQPTVRVSRSELDVLGVSLTRWDAGGQEKFRCEYLSEESLVLSDADHVLYFIDISDEDRFDESLKYLQDIVEAYQLTGDIPPFLICIHKADPSFITIKSEKRKMLPRWEIKEKVQNLKEKLSNTLKDVDYSVYLTSIYDQNSVLIAFSQVLKKIIPKLDLIDLVNLILKEFVESKNLLAAAIIERESLLFGEFISKKDIKDLFSASIINGITFYENLQVVKTIYKFIVSMENYEVVFATFKRKNKVYLLGIMGDTSKIGDTNQLINSFEEDYFERIYSLIEG